jgi:hypothetical protein
MSETATSTDSMEIGFCVFGEIEIDDNVDGLDVDTTGEEIGTDEIATDSLTEIVEDAITMSLKHFGVRVET